MVRWKRDLIYGIAIIIFSVFNYIYSFTLDEGTLKYALAQPGPYLRILLIIFAFLGALLIIKALVKKPTEVLKPIFHRMATFSIIVMVLFLLSMPLIGFIVSGLIFSSLTVFVYSYNAGKFNRIDGTKKSGKDLYKTILLYIIISILITMVTYIIFKNLLGVRLPVFTLF